MNARNLSTKSGSLARSPRAKADHGITFEAFEARQLLDGLPVVQLMQMDKFATEEIDDVARFGVKRTGSLAQPLTVYYTIGGTATPNEDYVGLSGIIRIPAGKRFASLPVLPIDDFEVDPNETVRITLSAKATYALNLEDAASESMVIRIADDDVLPVVRMLMPDREASEYGPNNGLFVIKRTGPLELPLTVTLRIGGSANGDSTKGPVDYLAIPRTISFAPGVDRYEIEVDAINDNILEGDETVRITIVNGADYDLDLSNVRNYSNTIRISDRPLVTMFVVDPVATTEPGDDAIFLFHRTGDLTSELRIKVTIAGSAREGQDYEDLPRTIIFAPGESIARVNIVGLGTRFPEAFRTIRLNLAAGPQYNTSPTAFSGEIRLYDDQLSAAV